VETGQYGLDLSDERLWNGVRPVQISNKAFQLLRLFVSKPDKLLTKEHNLDGTAKAGLG
jgi:DNA-binding response OmpR family regulator